MSLNFNKLIPEISVISIEKSKDFYINTIGFHLEYERPEDKFAFISLNGAQLMIEEINNSWLTGPLEKPLGRGVNFQIEVTNAESLYEKLKNEGHSFFRALMFNTYETSTGPETQSEFLIQDPDGYLLRFCS